MIHVWSLARLHDTVAETNASHIVIDFARPQESIKLKMAWDMLHKLNFGVFGQMIVIPLMLKHRVLTQVAELKRAEALALPHWSNGGSRFIAISTDHISGRRSFT